MKKSEQSVLEQHRPWKPPSYEPADASAIQALGIGNATPDQQKRALTWIIEKASARYDMPYRPGGHEGERDTNFALGKMSVGISIVYLMKLKIGLLEPRRKE